MKMNKNGAELTMNVIIIAAIGLLVLVILAVMLFGAGESINEGTSCASIRAGAECKSSCDTGEIRAAGSGSCPVDTYCCLPFGSNDN